MFIYQNYHKSSVKSSYSSSDSSFSLALEIIGSQISYKIFFYSSNSSLSAEGFPSNHSYVSFTASKIVSLSSSDNLSANFSGSSA
mmetsp:Transcript_19363/g.1716  ORF Transcript_19363/g.1716 Transcript_19363/m.1716 type:complete len:85 (-) Transcript_19363:683-937(-)